MAESRVHRLGRNTDDPGAGAVDELSVLLAPRPLARWVARDLLQRCQRDLPTALAIAEQLNADQLAGRAPVPRFLPIPAATAAKIIPSWLADLPQRQRSLLLVILLEPRHELALYVEAAHRLGLQGCELDAVERTGLICRVDDRIEVTDVLAASAVVAGCTAHEVYQAHRLLAELLHETGHAKAWCHRIRTVNALAAGDVEKIRDAAVGLLRRNEFLDAYWLLSRAATTCPDPTARDRLQLWAAETCWQMGFVENTASTLDELRLSDAAHPDIDSEINLLSGVCEAAGGGRHDVGIRLLAAQATVPGVLGLRATTAAIYLGWATHSRQELATVAGHLDPVPASGGQARRTAILALLAGRTDLDEEDRRALLGLGQSSSWKELLMPRLWPPFLLAQYLGEEELEIALLERELAGRKRRGAWMGTAPMLAMLADSRFVRGEWAVAWELVTEVQSELPRFRHPVVTAEIWLCCLFIAVRCGRSAAADEALGQFGSTVGSAVALGDLPALDIVACLRAADSDEPGTAAEHALRVVALCRDRPTDWCSLACTAWTCWKR